MTRRSLPPIAGVLSAVALLAACADDSATASGAGSAPETGAIQVVAAFYPLEYLAASVGGERADVTGLTPPGAEPHDLELTPQTLATLQESDIAIVLSGFQPAIDDGVAGVDGTVVDLAAVADRPYAETAEEHAAEEEEHGDLDPHFWLDPVHMVDAAGVIAAAFTEADPDGAEEYAANLAAVTDELTALDEEAEAAFASCEVETLVTAHDAFGYFADRYGFDVRPINGLSPDQEPEPGALAEISDFVSGNGVTTVYTEVLVSSQIAGTVAAEAGAETAVLDPVEGITDESAAADYPGVMRANIEAVSSGQVCT